VVHNKNKKKHKFHGKGTLFVISAPSGAGKTTLCRKLLERIPGLKLSVSYTTRSPRNGEKNGIDYSFVSESMFKTLIDKGEFAEWAMVHGNLYGTSLKRLKQLNKEGYDIILDIDIHGAMQIKNTYGNATYIFILPPSIQVLKKRLVNRKTESKERISKRLDNAKDEIKSFEHYDYIVINDDFEKAYRELESIITAKRLRTANTDPRWIKELIK
jgi:guanylate kinase